MTAQSPTPGESNDSEVQAEPSFWQRPFVQEVMPFLTSLMLHIGLIAIGILAYQTITHLTTREQAYVPDTGKLDENEGLLLRPPGSDDPKLPDTEVYKVPPTNTPGGSGGTAGLPDGALMPISSSSLTSDSSGFRALRSTGGLGSDATASGKAGIGGLGDGFGLNRGNGTDFFGLPTGHRGQPPARKICYVCDASGSMLGRFDELRTEIVKSVSSLRTGQFFNVIFFQENETKPMTTGELLPANAFNKDKCSKFVEAISARNTTNPIPSLEVAFKQHPELIYLLTDGQFDDNEVVVKWIADHNKDHKIKINTIHYVTSAEDPKAVLTKIAKDNGGVFRVVEEK